MTAMRIDKNSQIYSWSFHHPDFKNPEIFFFKDLYDTIISFERNCHLDPTRIGVNGKGYSNNQIMLFEKGEKQLEKNRFKGIESISIYTNESDYQDFAFYWKMLCSVSISKIVGSHLYIGYCLCTLKDKKDILEELIKPLVYLFKPQYGYAYVSRVSDGPFGYGSGFIHTPDDTCLDEDQKEAITKWSNNTELISEGKLRDLYQINILSNTQINSKMDGNSLGEWIKMDENRGTLTRFSDLLFLWTVSALNYNEIREELNRHGLLIAYDRYVLPTELVSD